MTHGRSLGFDRRNDRRGVEHLKFLSNVRPSKTALCLCEVIMKLEVPWPNQTQDTLALLRDLLAFIVVMTPGRSLGLDRRSDRRGVEHPNFFQIFGIQKLPSAYVKL